MNPVSLVEDFISISILFSVKDYSGQVNRLQESDNCMDLWGHLIIQIISNFSQNEFLKLPNIFVIVAQILAESKNTSQTNVLEVQKYGLHISGKPRNVVLYPSWPCYNYFKTDINFQNILIGDL